MLSPAAGEAAKVGGTDSRVVAALIAAFRTVVKGGLMPHDRQGGTGVAAVAVVGSKLEGRGLENEQIGQIQVALIGFGDGDFCGVAECETGEYDFVH